MPQRGRAAPSPATEQQAEAFAFAILEDIPRVGFVTHGRGFLLYAVYPKVPTRPYLRYHTQDDPMGADTLSTEPDLQELVRTYDPQTSFVLFAGTLNVEKNQLEEIRIEVWNYATGLTRSA